MDDAGGVDDVERQGADDKGYAISAELLEEWAQLADAYGKTGLDAQDIFLICKNTWLTCRMSLVCLMRLAIPIRVIILICLMCLLNLASYASKNNNSRKKLWNIPTD